MKYSKSILSLVTILALNSSVMADTKATYVPLSSKAYDNAWIMFGVNDFADGIASAVSDGVFTAGYSSVDEASTTDDLVSPSDAVVTAAVAGTYFNDIGTNNMATFQALKDASGVAYYTIPVTMALQTSDLTYSETQPIRTMYIAIQVDGADTNTISKIKLNYKADLEGRKAELQLNNAGTIFTVTISETSTFNNPGIAKYTPPVAGTPILTAPEDTLIYNLTDAPIVPASYAKATHQGTAIGNERFYNYNAATGVWILWDRAKVTANANTLTNFEKGKAYWGRVDINADSTTTSNAPSGLYLGKTGLTTADAAVYTNNLTADSWNMLAFDPASNQDIRNSTTGVTIATNALADADAIRIVDETGTNYVDINFTLAATYNTDAKVAKHFNASIDAAKLKGLVPETFYVKAFPSSVGISIVSDKIFTLKDMVGNVIAATKTLANQDVINPVTGAVTTVADVNVTGITSRYGEYALLVEPLVGANTAAELDNVVSGGGTALSAKVQFGDIKGDSLNGASSATPLGLAPNDTTSTLATAVTALSIDDIFDGTKATGRIIQIDSNFDTTNDMVLLASDKPFYIKDHTYTRIYAVDSTTVNGTPTSASANIAYTVKSKVSAALTPANNDAAAAFVTAINAVADTATATVDTKTYSAVDGANLVVVTADSPLMDLLDADSALKDYFTETSSSADISKGAIKQVIDISRLARQDVIRNRVKVTFLTDVPASGSTIELNTTVNSVDINPTATTVLSATDTDTKRLVMLDSLVTKVNAAFKASDVAAFASHNYVDGYNDITKAVITIDGLRVLTTTFDINASTTPTATIVEINTKAGELSVSSAAIIADLKDNPIYTPDYVNYGPLYTLKDAGYEAKAILRASTQLAVTPTTHWDAIDLTRASKDWLKNNEFNLFNVNNAAGYWTYVTSYTNPNTIIATNVIYTPTYVYHFNPITNTTNNIINTAAFSVAIAGADAATSNAKLVIGGNEIQLVNTGSTYTANINRYEAGLVTQSTNTIAIKVADGLGERYDNLNLTQVDYTKPAIPSITFTTTSEAALADTSADVVNYYLWKNFIPDDGTNATGPNATTANLCTDTVYNSLTDYKLVAIDSVGTFGKGNISNAKAFTFANTQKDATVLTHSFGDSAATAVRYDTVCVATANTTKSGVEVTAQEVGTVKLSYQHITGSINVTNDIPVTAYYDIAGSGTAVVQVNSVPAYAGKTFYVQYQTSLYTGTFPSDRAAGDASFSVPLVMTAVVSENQTLD